MNTTLETNETNPNETTSQQGQVPAHSHPRVDWDALLKPSAADETATTPLEGDTCSSEVADVHSVPDATEGPTLAEQNESTSEEPSPGADESIGERETANFAGDGTKAVTEPQRELPDHAEEAVMPQDGPVAFATEHVHGGVAQQERRLDAVQVPAVSITSGPVQPPAFDGQLVIPGPEPVVPIALRPAANEDTTKTNGPSSPADARRRRANPTDDNIWTRHHVLCLMGMTCDVLMGGYDAARLIANPLKEGLRASEVISTALSYCPWLLNANYLNLAGSAGLDEHGIEACFRSWAANRIYYFYREKGEHPNQRVRSNISAVYRDFYAAFSSDLLAGTVISEERAKAFWIDVSYQVPFRLPAEAQGATSSPQASEHHAAPSASNVQEGGLL